MSTPPAQDRVDRWREVVVMVATFAIAVLAISLGGSWQFGLGFVLLILVHEFGHVFEARRQGLHVSLPTFNPFGAYVTVRHAGIAPWRSALISLAGPLAGGLGAAVVWAVGARGNTDWLVQLAYWGFLLNAANMVPVGILDGGAIVRGISQSRRGWIRYENGIPVEAMPSDTEHANLILLLYVALAAALVAGFLATRHSAML